MGEEELNPFELEDDEPSAPSRSPAPPAAPVSAPRASASVGVGASDGRGDPGGAPEWTCPVCLMRVRSGARQCLQCGYDDRKGIQSSRLVTTQTIKDPDGSERRGVLCSNCSFEMTGLKALVCPECGTRHTPRRREEHRREAAARAMRMAILRPLIMLLVGLVITTTIVVLKQDDAALLKHVIKYPMQISVGFLVLLICQVIWIGFDAPAWLNLLRVAGYYALCDVLVYTLGLLPALFFIVQYIAQYLTYVLLWVEDGDQDVQDAGLLGMLTFVGWVIAHVVVFWVLNLPGALAGP